MEQLDYWNHAFFFGTFSDKNVPKVIRGLKGSKTFLNIHKNIFVTKFLAKE